MEPASNAEGFRELLDVLAETARESVEACNSCGLCLGVCPVYRATSDKSLSPPARLKIVKDVLESRFAAGKAQRSLFTCLMCGLCSYACPYAVPVWLAVYYARVVLAVNGFAPRGLDAVPVNAARTGHSFTSDPFKARAWVETVRPVKVDEPAEHLYIPSPLETIRFPRLVSVKLRLMERLGVDYTVSLETLDVGGNVSLDASRPDIGLNLLAKAFGKAEEIGADYVLVSECGADVKFLKTIVPVVAEKLGLQSIRVKTVHEVFLERTRRLPSEEDGEPVLFTSCNYCRLAGPCPLLPGLHLPRDRPPYTSCCGGGGGMTICYEEWAKNVRRKVSAKRLVSLKAKKIIVPCVKCYASLREASIITKKRVDVKLFSEYLAGKLRENLAR